MILISFSANLPGAEPDAGAATHTASRRLSWVRRERGASSDDHSLTSRGLSECTGFININ